MGYVYLAVAIVAEVLATSALKYSDGMSRALPSVVVITGYVLAFYSLSLVLKTIPVGTAYAIWAGTGIALIALVGYFVFDQRLDAPAVIGMLLIISGVIVIFGFSKSAA